MYETLMSDNLIATTLSPIFSVKVMAKNSSQTRFLHNFSASYTENSNDVVTQSVRGSHSPAARLRLRLTSRRQRERRHGEQYAQHKPP